MDVYKKKINETEYLYHCICHKDWHDLQMKIQEVLEAKEDKEKAAALSVEIQSIQDSYLLKYIVEPKIEDIDTLDEYVYGELIKAIVEKAMPKNSQ